MYRCRFVITENVFDPIELADLIPEFPKGKTNGDQDRDKDQGGLDWTEPYYVRSVSGKQPNGLTARAQDVFHAERQDADASGEKHQFFSKRTKHRVRSQKIV